MKTRKCSGGILILEEYSRYGANGYLELIRAATKMAPAKRVKDKPVPIFLRGVIHALFISTNLGASYFEEIRGAQRGQSNVELR